MHALDSRETWNDADLLAALRRIFGYTSFRPQQRDIIRGILDGRDSLSIMPTGGGKSLCFQLPAALRDGVCVVISPLISLMKDQVDAACANGLRAAALNSSLDAAGRGAVHAALREGALDLLYISPERLNVPGFWDTLAALPLAFLFGVLVERGFVRPLLGRNVVAVIMATIGLAAALDGGVQLLWGPDLKYLPGSLPDLGFEAGGVYVSSRAVWNLLLALPLGLGLLWLLRKSRYGVLVRAISEREVAALALGIPTARILAGVWGVSALLATLAGALLAAASGVGHNLVFFGLKVFPVAILGGLDAVGGALAAGFLLGVLEALSQRYLEAYLPGFTEALPFVVVLLVLLVRPYGLFGERQIERV